MDELIKLELHLQDVNFILEALADKPYRDVFVLIANIKKQADPQVQENKSFT